MLNDFKINLIKIFSLKDYSFEFNFKKNYFENKFKFKRSFRLVIFLLLLSLFFSKAFSQVNDLNLEHILSDVGLSQNTIHSIIQDHLGFMWFATEDGLNKYDGYNFTVYKNDPADETTISDNFIWTIYEDSEGNIWSGTNNGGLSMLDRSTETFINYKNNPSDKNCISNNNVRCILEDKNGYLWIGTEGGGLNKLDRKTKTFFHYKHDPSDPKSLSNNIVLSLYEDREGNLWVGSNNGLDKLNKNDGAFTHYSNGTLSSVILSIYKDKRGTIWAGSLSGLNKLDEEKKIFINYHPKPSGLKSLINEKINSIIEDDNNFLWLGTGSGIYIFNQEEKSFSRLYKYLSNSNSYDRKFLSGNNVLSLCEDASGIIWIGTAESGILKYDDKKMKFKHYFYQYENPNGLSHNTIRSIFEDGENILWIGTLGGGLNKLDRNKNKFTHYKNDPLNEFSLSDNSVSAIYRDKKGILWIGTWGGGLNKIDEKSGKFIRYKHSADPFSLADNIIQVIYEDSYKNFWIGTGSGLDLFDRNKNKFIHYINDPSDLNSLSDNQVQSCILEDDNGDLWVGTWNGLTKIILSKEKNSRGKVLRFIQYKHSREINSLSDNRIISIYKDEKKNLWLGTHGGGINLLPFTQQNVDPAKAKFKSYSAKNGLASDIVYGILSDEENNLWFSTDNGLSKFNPETETFRNYYKSDGLQGNRFFWGASCKSENGELIFGGTNGFNIFYPSSITENNHIPPIVITDFQIFNKSVGIGSDSPLKKTINETKEIKLSYDQNVFSFEFSALDYTIPKKNQYAYMMQGFDKTWINAGNRRYVTYTNLDQGEYTFKVKGSNNDGIWNEKGASLKIIIMPPFWKTWWFIIASILIFGGIIAALIYYRVKNLLEIERLRIKLAADLHDNIGSSLTEISILSEIISKQLKTANQNVVKSLKMISDNSRNLIDNMSDIVWLVNPKRDSVYDLIIKLRDTYSELSSFTDISFRSKNLKSLEKISLSMEHRQHLYLIFKEGLNNCISHSGCSEISLDAFVKGKKLQMILKDNGSGINGKNNSAGNGLENMKRRAQMIGGELFIDSKNGNGTTIQFVGNIL